jgi:regulator of protease activity HflC (stomatin/prohibitin superfamily)
MVDEHGHSHAHAPADAGETEALDAAGQSLADALRVSFRLLTFIMVLLFVGFLCSGITCINPQEVGIKKTFGRVVGVAEQGLTYTWPYPIGEIEKIAINEKQLEVEDFWMHETPQDKTKDLSERAPSKLGLRPGWDGALLTGDRYLLHVHLTCNYRIADALAFKEVVGSDPEAEKEIIRSAVCSGVIHAASDRTAEGIMGDHLSFTLAVKEHAQRQLSDALGIREQSVRLLEGMLADADAAGRTWKELRLLTATERGGRIDALPGRADDKAVLADLLATNKAGAGILISNISMRPPTWPLQARAAYEVAQRAVQQQQQTINKAQADARGTLTDAAGQSYVALVIDSSGTIQDEGANDGGWIGRYEKARGADRDAEAEQLLEEIDTQLDSQSTAGEARGILDAAESDKTATIQGVRQDVEAFEQLLPGFRKTPKFLLERKWAETLEDILSAPTNEKIVVEVRGDTVVIRTKQDPRVAKEILRARLKAQKQDADRKKESP